MDSAAAVGRRLQEARTGAGLSQRELAFPGCSPAYISRIERGQRTPSLQVLRELARRCGVSERFLAWGRTDSVHEPVAEQIHALEHAIASGTREEQAAVYAALARAAGRAARMLRA
ncbi:MAG TPA: helix-turn-helix transcriptional regulator [Gaiellaceae bacterium]|nr:helix-turn-helix transcriptional regulator [Gaiellaceae bacterium]